MYSNSIDSLKLNKLKGQGEIFEIKDTFLLSCPEFSFSSYTVYYPRSAFIFLNYFLIPHLQLKFFNASNCRALLWAMPSPENQTRPTNRSDICGFYTWGAHSPMKETNKQTKNPKNTVRKVPTETFNLYENTKERGVTWGWVFGKRETREKPASWRRAGIREGLTL